MDIMNSNPPIQTSMNAITIQSPQDSNWLNELMVSSNLSAETIAYLSFKKTNLKFQLRNYIHVAAQKKKKNSWLQIDRFGGI